MALQIHPSILWLKVLTSSARFQADVVACESEMANAISNVRKAPFPAPSEDLFEAGQNVVIKKRMP